MTNERVNRKFNMEAKKTRGRKKKEAAPVEALVFEEPEDVPFAPYHPIEGEVTCLVIGDPHFKLSNMTEMQEMVNKTLDLARERRPTFIVCLGDVFDTHDKLYQQPQTLATDWLYALQQIAPLVLIVGNHDRISNNTFLSTQHAFTAQKYWSNISVVDQGAIHTFGGHQFVFVPYVPPGRLEEALAIICTRHCTPEAREPDYALVGEVMKNTTACFSHQEYRGAKMGPIVSKHGDVWAPDRPLMISGHIHEYGHLAPNLVYVGTPLQHANSDRPDKTVGWFTTSGRTMVEERVDLNLTKKICVRIAAADFESMDMRPYNPKRCHLVLLVEGTAAEFVKLTATPKYQAWAPYIRQQRRIEQPVLQPLPSDGMPRSNTSKPYMTALYDEVKCIPELIPVFQRIFAQN